MRSFFERHRYWGVLAAQVFLLFIATLMQDHPMLSLLFIVALFGVFGSVIRTIWERSLPRIFALTVAAITIVSGLLGFSSSIPWWEIQEGLIVCCFGYATFILIAMVSIARHVFVTDRVTANRIVGSICLYLMLGMFFAFIYAGMALINPAAFEMSSKGLEMSIVGLRDFLYFSYATITTTGYGDMIPTLPMTRFLSSMESVAGSVYMAIMVARLVGMHVTQAHGERGR